jgi:hypothetical protein
MASACASMTAAVGLCRTKLQLLQPIAGVLATPLFSAWAGGANALPTMTNAATTPPKRMRFMLTFHCVRPMNRTGAPAGSQDRCSGLCGYVVYTISRDPVDIDSCRRSPRPDERPYSEGLRTTHHLGR